jgi:hypothetical protein
MARGRLISKSLGTSRKFHALLSAGGKLGEFCQLLYPLIVANSDDFGRLPGDAFTVKNLVLPTSRRPEKDFDRALDVMDDVGIIVRYHAGGAQYVQVVDFDAHQVNLHKRTSSIYPHVSECSRSLPELPAQSNLTKPNRTQENRTEPPEAREADRLFEEFWTAYPRKTAKADARKAWDKRRPDEALLTVMLAALAIQRQSEAWQKDRGRYIPYPATWIGGARWTDVLEPELTEPGPSGFHRQGTVTDIDWFDECKRLHDGLCNGRSGHDLQMRLDAARKAS